MVAGGYGPQMPEPVVLPTSQGEAAPPWRRFVASQVQPRTHARLRRAIVTSMASHDDVAPTMVAVVGPPRSGKTTLLHAVRRTLIACGAIQRVHMLDERAFFAGVAGARVLWLSIPAMTDVTEDPAFERYLKRPVVEVRLRGAVQSPVVGFYESIGTLDVLTWVDEKGATHV